MKKEKILKELVEQTVVDENGEVRVAEIKKTYNVSKEPEFVKLYIADLAMLEGLPKSVTAVLYGLLKQTRYANESEGIFFINSFVKKQILLNSKTLQSTQTISNAITVLKKKGILIDKGREAYIFNPNIFGRGDWRDIQKLRLHITYDSSGRTLSTEVINQIVNGEIPLNAQESSETHETITVQENGSLTTN